MHKTAANRVRPHAASFISPAVEALGAADRLWLFPLIRKFGRVMEHKNGAVGSGHTIMGRLEMTGQNVRLADSLIGEKRRPSPAPKRSSPAARPRQIGSAAGRERVCQYGESSGAARASKKKDKT